MNDLISVIIPTYNGEKYIAECIDSIRHQGMATEIIVVDDISTDRTVQIARSKGCKVIVNEIHKGQVAGKNTGIKNATGRYWLTIDQDDFLADNALKRLYECITKTDDTYIVEAKLKDFCSPDTPEQAKYVKPQPFRGILTGAVLFKKEVFDMIGLFREDIITGDMIDLENRLKKTSVKITKVDFVTCHRRIHNQNFGCTNQKKEYQDYLKLLRERLLKQGI